MRGGAGPRDFKKYQPATRPALHEYTVFGPVTTQKKKKTKNGIFGAGRVHWFLPTPSFTLGADGT
jgi:hypothetical protein